MSPIRSAELVAEFRGDARHFDRTVDRVEQAIAGLIGRDPEVHVRALTGAAERDVASFVRQLSGVRDEDVHLNVDAASAMQEVTGVGRLLSSLEDERVRLDVDASGASGEITSLASSLMGLGDETVRVLLDNSGVAQELAGVRSALDIPDESVRLSVDTSEASAEIETLKSSLGGIGGVLAGVGLGSVVGGWSGSFQAFEDQVSGAATATGASMMELSRIAAGFEIIPPEVAAGGINQLSQIGVAFGKTGSEALSSSRELLNVAQAASAVVGVPVQEVVDGMASSFRGEFDALQRVIPAISAASIEQAALATTGKASVAELTAQEKALAAQAVILGEGAGLLSQYAANQDTQAFASKRMTDATSEASIAMGEAFAPAVTTLMEAVTGLANVFTSLPQSMQTVLGVGAGLAVGVGALAAAFGPLLLFLGGPGGAIGMFGRLTGALPGVGALFAALTGPVGIAVAAIAAAIGIGVLIVKNWDTIKAAASALWQFVQDAFSAGVDFLKGVVGGVVGFITESWDRAKALTSAAWDALTSAITDTIRGAADFVQSIVDRVVGFISGAWERARDLTLAAWTGLREAVGNAIGGVIDLVQGIPGKVLDALGNVGSLLMDAGRGIIGGLIDGIMSGFRRVKDTLSDLTSFLPDWKGPADTDRKLLFDAGRLIMGGFERGLLSQFGSVEATLRSLSVAIPGALDPSTLRMAPPRLPSSSSTSPAGSRGDTLIELHFHGPVVGGEAGMRDLAKKLADVTDGRVRVSGR